MKIGYIRVSTQEQNTIRQEALMEVLGVDEIYMDKISGKNRQHKFSGRSRCINRFLLRNKFHLFCSKLFDQLQKVFRISCKAADQFYNNGIPFPHIVQHFL